MYDVICAVLNDPFLRACYIRTFRNVKVVKETEQTYYIMQTYMYKMASQARPCIGGD